MKKMINLLVVFIVTVLFLSIKIKDKTIFSYIHKTIYPATDAAQGAVEGFFGRTVITTQAYSKKLFDNSVPKLKDSVKSKMSSAQRAPQEDITTEDKKELDELIKSHY